MFSLIARRTAVRLPLLVRPQLPTRTFITTTRLLATRAANASSTTTPKSTSKTATKSKSSAKAKTTKGAAKKKSRKVAKKKPVPKKKKVVRKKAVKPQPLRITKDMRPPPRPATSYCIFFKEYLERTPRSTSAVGVRESGSNGGKAWHALPDEEKQRYTDMYREAYAQWRKDMDVWKEQVDPKVLRELNRQRKAKGKPRIVVRKEGIGLPLNPWFRFVKDVRGEFNPSQVPQGEKYISWFTARAKERWDSMSEAEKKPYSDPYKRELEEWRANRDVNKSI